MLIASIAPGEIKDFTLDWSLDLGTDTIVTSSWSVSAPDLLTNSRSSTNTTTTTTVWLSGSTIDNQYVVTNTITTEGGRTLTESFLVNAVDYRMIDPCP